MMLKWHSLDVSKIEEKVNERLCLNKSDFGMANIEKNGSVKPEALKKNLKLLTDSLNINRHINLELQQLKNGAYKEYRKELECPEKEPEEETKVDEEAQGTDRESSRPSEGTFMVDFHPEAVHIPQSNALDSSFDINDDREFNSALDGSKDIRGFLDYSKNREMSLDSNASSKSFKLPPSRKQPKPNRNPHAQSVPLISEEDGEISASSSRQVKSLFETEESSSKRAVLKKAKKKKTKDSRNRDSFLNKEKLDKFFEPKDGSIGKPF